MQNYKIVFWLQGKLYKLQQDEQISSEILKETPFLPIQSEILINKELAEKDLDSLSYLLAKQIGETVNQFQFQKPTVNEKN